MVAFFEVPEPQVTQLNSLQLDDRMAYCLEHPADLALAPFVDCQLELVRPDLAHLGGCGAAIVELDPIP